MVQYHAEQTLSARNKTTEERETGKGAKAQGSAKERNESPQTDAPQRQ